MVLQDAVQRAVRPRGAGGWLVLQPRPPSWPSHLLALSVLAHAAVTAALPPSVHWQRSNLELQSRVLVPLPPPPLTSPPPLACLSPRQRSNLDLESRVLVRAREEEKERRRRAAWIAKEVRPHLEWAGRAAWDGGWSARRLRERGCGRRSGASSSGVQWCACLQQAHFHSAALHTAARLCPASFTRPVCQVMAFWGKAQRVVLYKARLLLYIVCD